MHASPTPPDAHCIGGPRYRHIAGLGEGGMGCVVEAVDTTTGEHVAIKWLHERLASDQSIERLRTEAEIPMLLKHPNIVRVFDLAMPPSAPRPFLVMELLEGRTLHEQIHLGGPIPLGDAIEIARQVLAGLGAAHRAGVVHRDVKLGNIFLCSCAENVPHVKLIDFGIAKLLPSRAQGLTPHSFRTREGAYLGTARYVSPEQASGKDIDPRSDLYAMGIVLYAMLTGRGPFDDAVETASLLRAHVCRTPEPPSKHAASPVPPALDGLILNALAKRAEDRLSSAEDFAAALENIGRRLRAPVGGLKTRWFDASALQPGKPGTGPEMPSTTEKMAPDCAPAAKPPEAAGDHQHEQHLEAPVPHAPSASLARFVLVAATAAIVTAALVLVAVRMVQ